MTTLNRALRAALICSLALGMQVGVAGDLSIKNGQYQMRDGKPLRAVGVNYFDAINRAINNPKDTSALDGLVVLRKYEIPFVRVMFGGFWPNEIRLYEADRTRYFELLDRFVRAAEDNQIGIVASLAWNYAAIPDLVGEPASAWGRKGSKTLAYFERYVTDVVQRYRASPAIWMWEFGNEMALYVDLPNASQWRPRIDTSKGTPPFRGEVDDLDEATYATALALFAQWLHAIDPMTPLSTGNALPRPYAFNNRKERSWRADSRDQFCEMLARDNPPGFDVVSIHLYPHNRGYFGKTEHDSREILAQVSACASPLGQPVFVGEFGVADTEKLPVGETPRSAFATQLRALEEAKIGLSAVWVFDFSYHESSINITLTNKRAYQLDAIRSLNRRLRAGS